VKSDGEWSGDEFVNNPTRCLADKRSLRAQVSCARFLFHENQICSAPASRCLRPRILIARATAQAPAKPAAADSSTVVFETTRCAPSFIKPAPQKCLRLRDALPSAHLYIQLNAAKFRVTTPDGKVEIVEGKAGEVGWEPAVTHRVESVSGESVTTYLVEVKDKDWKPSTNLSL